ncbi:hypothetical protein ACFQJD_10750 [Haloplanus sp. GCM10025708]|uniref:hypothetical protein n=1 Tax=Haloplanus sp. GCM10025708 TaxID=3252679 RepID=UPI00360BA232
MLALVQLTGSAGRIGGGALVDRLPAADARASAQVLVAQGVLATALFVVVALVETPSPPPSRSASSACSPSASPPSTTPV